MSQSLSIFVCGLQKMATNIFVWCVCTRACCFFHMEVPVHFHIVVSFVLCPMFGLGILDILAHPCSCSGCWRSSFDCLFGHVGSLIAAVISLCLLEFVSNINQVCEEDCLHEFVVCQWVVFGPVICVVCFSVTNKNRICFVVCNHVTSGIACPLLWWSWGWFCWWQCHWHWNWWFVWALASTGSPFW